MLKLSDNMKIAMIFTVNIVFHSFVVVAFLLKRDGTSYMNSKKKELRMIYVHERNVVVE